MSRGKVLFEMFHGIANLRLSWETHGVHYTVKYGSVTVRSQDSDDEVQVRCRHGHGSDFVPYVVQCSVRQ